MDKEERIKQFKASLDSIDLIFELTDEQVFLKKKKAFIDNIVYLGIKQNFLYERSHIAVEYNLEYRVDPNVIILEISSPKNHYAFIEKKMEEFLEYKGDIQNEVTKERIISKIYYKFEDLHLLTSIGVLMLELNKRRRW